MRAESISANAPHTVPASKKQKKPDVSQPLSPGTGAYGDSVRIDVTYETSTTDAADSYVNGERWAQVPKKNVDRTEPDALSPNDQINAQMEAVHIFAEAFDALLDALNEAANNKDTAGNRTARQMADTLRAVVYRPVELAGRSGGNERISLYEIGLAHSPDKEPEASTKPDVIERLDTRKRTSGHLAVNEPKLTVALLNRAADTADLFVKDGEGLLARIGGILSPPPAYTEQVHACTSRFLYACARIRACF